MKKIAVLLIVFVLTAGLSFAQEEREIELINVELGLGFPVHWSKGIHNDTFYIFNSGYKNPDDTKGFGEDITVTANTSFGVGITFNFTRIIGLSIDGDFFFGGKLAGFSAPTSDYISLFGANVFLGPTFYVYNDNKLRIPLSVGVHMYYFADDIWVPELNASTPETGKGAWLNRTDLQLGAVLSIGVQFHFNSGIYVFSKTQVALDFVRFHSIKGWYTTDVSNAASFVYNDKMDIVHLGVNWGIKPVIGIGITY